MRLLPCYNPLPRSNSQQICIHFIPYLTLNKCNTTTFNTNILASFTKIRQLYVSVMLSTYSSKKTRKTHTKITNID